MSKISSSAAIIGGGTMGGDVALVFAGGGWQTHIVEPTEKTRKELPKRLKMGLRRLKSPAQRFECLHLHQAMESVPWEEIEIVVENAPEVLEIKQQVFRQLEKFALPGTTLTSNSSSFPISQIGAGLKDQTRIAGLHFFMPAHIVPCVEVIRCQATAPGLPEKLAAIMRSLGKVPVQVQRDVPGFLINRLQHALMREALFLVENGIASIEDVDRGMRYGYGFRFLAAGPLLQKDLSGIDIHHNAAATIYPYLCNDSKPSKLLSDLVKAKYLGVKSKSKKGFYSWTDKIIAKEKARYEALLSAGLKLLLKELKNRQG